MGGPKKPERRDLWAIPRLWPDQPCFVVAGGPSVKEQDVSLLKGRNVIAVNRSFELVPFAPFMFFGDSRFWLWPDYRDKLLTVFEGEIVTTANLNTKRPGRPPHVGADRVKCLGIQRPQRGLSTDPKYVTIEKTSLTATINLAYLLGANPIFLLGADMQRAPAMTIEHKGHKKTLQGESHHHGSHPWPPAPGCWDLQMRELSFVAKWLEERKVRVINASPRSRIEFWKRKTFEECLAWQEPSLPSPAP